MGTRTLWEPDETRYAEVAREMRASGDLALLRLNGEPYTHKPPLFIWAIAALQEMGLPTTAASMLPAFAALLLLLPALRALAAATGLPREHGSAAFALLASSPLAAGMGLLARMDIVLALTNTAALVGLAGLLLPRAGGRAGRGPHLLLWAAIGVGVLAKGPVALAMPAATALLAWLLLSPRPSLRPVLVGWGPALAVAIVLAWLVPAAIAGGPAVLHELVVTQSAGRLTSSFAHRQPFYFHFLTYPLTGLPWSPVVVVATFAALRRRVLDGTAFLAATVAGVILFFSLVSGKLEIYLLPLFPPAALLVASALARRAPRWALAVGAAALAVAGVAIAAAPGLRPELADAVVMARVAGAVLAGTATVALALAMRRPGPAAVAALALAGLTVPAVVIPCLAAPLDRSLGVAPTAAAVSRLEPDIDEGLVYRSDLAGLSLYARRTFRRIDTEPELASALASGRCVAVLERDWMKLGIQVRGLADEVARQPFRRRTLLVVRGRTGGPD